jgi:hypothetical protein
MRKLRLKIMLVISIAGFASCSGDGLVDLGSSSDAKAAGRFRPPGERPEAFDFERECGIPADKANDENALLVNGSYTSFPIIVEGSKSVPIVGTIQYRVILQAKVNIAANSKGSTVTRNVNLATDANGKKLAEPAIAAMTAEGQAKKASGSTKTQPTPIAEWLKLTGPSGNPELKDLLCVITGAKSTTEVTGEGTLAATFSPALVNSVSPLAPPERMRKEIGSGRTFTVTANVTSVPRTGGFLEKADPNFKVGTKTGKITIRETKPTLSVVNQAANINRTINADIAYEVINEFPNGAYTVGLPKRSIYLIDTKTKSMKAIYIEADRPDPESGQPMTPPLVIVKDN